MLRAWYPFIKNTDNQGAGELNLATTFAPTYITGGKLGDTCLNSGGFKWTPEQTSSIFNNKEITIAFWIKVIGSTGGVIIGNDNMGELNNRKFSIYQYPNANSLHWSWMNDTEVFNSGVLNDILPTNTWVHFCITYKNPNTKVYINGVVVATASNNISNSSTFSYETQVLHNNPNRCIQDLRFYDNALSPKEVKLLSQGLIAHYQLKGMGATNYLKGAGKFLKDTPLVRNASDVSHMNDSYIYHEWPPNDIFAVLPNDGTYTISVECDGIGATHPTSGTTASQRLFSFFLQHTSSGAHYHFAMSKGADGKWYSTRSDLVAGTYKLRTNLYAADNVNYTLRFWNMKVSAGTYNPSDTWCPHIDDELYNNLGLGLEREPDCSGFNNDGAKSAILEVVNNCPRYGRSYRFSGSQYIACGRGAMVTDELTASCWAYSDNWVNSADIVSCAEGGGWDFWPNGSGQMTMEVRRNGGYITGVYPVKLANWAPGWHHIVGVYDGYKAEIYVDGIKGTTSATTTTKYPIQYHATNGLFIGAAAGSSETTPANKFFIGNISDVRLYATAFSSTDVENLYKNSAALTKDGKFLAYEFQENKKNSIDKDGIVASGGFNVDIIPTYDMKIKALGDGSTWARIHHLDASVSKDWFANDAEVAKGIDKHNRYSRMGVVDKYRVVDNNTSFVLHGDKIFDGSSNNLSITNNGVSISTSVYRASKGSLYFNGSSRLLVPSWNFSDGDFTIDWWEYPTSTSNGARFCSSYTTTAGTCGGLLLGYQGTKVYASTSAEGSWDLIAGIAMLSTTPNVWTHWAFVRKGNVLTSYRNGISFSSVTLNGNFGWSPNINFCIGDYRAGDHSYFIGYIDEFRISDIARWSGNFTPPTEIRDYEFMLTYPSMKKTLPAGYTKLEYIETTGSQWINTGVKGNARWEFDIEFKTDINHRQLMGYGGAGQEYWGVQTHGGYGVHESGVILKAKAGNRDTIVHNFGENDDYSIWGQNKSVTVNSMDVSEKEYQLFTIMSSTGYSCYAKLWRCKCVQGGKLIRDFVPAMRNSDNVIGLYDNINNVFYTNAGSGYFLSNYSWLDYIQSNGTQCINTGIIPTQDTRIIMDFEHTGKNTDVMTLFGARTATTSNVFGMWISNTSVYPHYGNVGYDVNGYIDITDKGRITYDLNSNIATVDNNTITCNTATFNSGSSLYLLAMNQNGTIDNRKASGKIYSCKIYNGSSLVRDFVPCNYGGAIGLWDNVNKVFYDNVGTGTFAWYKSGESQQLNYIQSSGTQYINTGLTENSVYGLKMVFEVPSYAIAWQSLLSGTLDTGFTIGTRDIDLTGLYVRLRGAEIINTTNIVSGKTEILIKDGSININGVQKATYTNGSLSDKTGYLYIFANNALSRYGNVKLYSLEFYDSNGNTLRKYIPCVNSFSRTGLYDEINKRFYNNSGTGNFITGTTIESLPLYNRWIQNSSPNASPNTGTGFKALTTSFTTYFYPITKSASSSSALYSMNISNNWWAPVGQKVTFNGGIPAADGSTQYETELWVRTDRFIDESQLNIYDSSLTAKDYVEV